MASVKPTIYIEVSGGVVQNISCNDAARKALEYLKNVSFGLRAVVVDYDHDADERIGRITRTNGDTERADVGEWSITIGDIDAHEETR